MMVLYIITLFISHKVFALDYKHPCENWEGFRSSHIAGQAVLWVKACEDKGYSGEFDIIFAVVSKADKTPISEYKRKSNSDFCKKTCMNLKADECSREIARNVVMMNSYKVEQDPSLISVCKNWSKIKRS